MNILMIILIIISIITTIYYLPYGIEMAIRVILAVFTKADKYKKADTKHKFAIIIPCRNEEEVIANTIRVCRKLKYPKDRFEIIVAAHNCTDNTAKCARDENVEVWEFNEDDPKHKKKGYIMRYIFNRLKEEKRDYESIIFLDADNILHEDFLDKMNDAFDSGLEIARPYYMPSTLSVSSTAFAGGIFVFFMTKVQALAKQKLKLNPTITGSAYMISMNVIKNIEWEFFTLAEDVELSTNITLKGYEIGYVEEAIVYESLNPNLKDNWNRHSRLANGCQKNCFKNKIKILKKFFSTFKYKYLSESISISEIVMATFTLVWTPVSLIITYFYFKENSGQEVALKIVLSILIPLIVFFIIGMYALAIFILFKEKKNIEKYSLEKITFWLKFKVVLFLPIYALFISLATLYGMVFPQKWKLQKRIVIKK